jgi:hypothetical protein
VIGKKFVDQYAHQSGVRNQLVAERAHNEQLGEHLRRETRERFAG